MRQESLHSGIFLSLTIEMDGESVANDSMALGACLQDLQREGWILGYLEKLDGGMLRACLTRSWHVLGPRFKESPAGSAADAEPLSPGAGHPLASRGG